MENDTLEHLFLGCLQVEDQFQRVVVCSVSEEGVMDLRTNKKYPWPPCRLRPQRPERPLSPGSRAPACACGSRHRPPVFSSFPSKHTSCRLPFRLLYQYSMFLL